MNVAYRDKTSLRGLQIASSRIIGFVSLLLICSIASFAPAQDVDTRVPQLPLREPKLEPLDPQQLQTVGIRAIPGKYLTLYTDLPKSEAIDGLPQLFDLALPQWANYFDISPKALESWQMRGFLMKEKARFVQAGLLGRDLPAFRNGYSRGWQLWMYEQENDYYRRHLLLHEGSHGFMNTVLGGCGPGWYMEAMAEMFGTHEYKDGKLTLGIMPKRREDVPMLGRIKLVREEVAANRLLTLAEVMQIDNRKHLDNKYYGWCWAAAFFLDRHPAYQERFRRLPKLVLRPDFNRRVLRMMQHDWEDLEAGWQVFASSLVHNHDVRATAVSFAEAAPLANGRQAVQVAARRGWQNTQIQLVEGKRYLVESRGQFQVANRPKPWISEAGGVTIRYFQGKPLGQLQAAIVTRNEDQSWDVSELRKPRAIGLSAEILPRQTGTLFLKINDSPGELGDNSGLLDVKISLR